MIEQLSKEGVKGMCSKECVKGMCQKECVKGVERYGQAVEKRIKRKTFLHTFVPIFITCISHTTMNNTNGIT